MAFRLIWSPEAIEDVESIAAYIERDSAWYAKAVVSKIVATIDEIPQYPELGRTVPELNDSSIRERFVFHYRIIYRVEPARVLIVAVIHGSRLIENELSRRESPR